jgi:DNA replication protein DnaC
MIGSTGLGKTHLSSAIAKEVLKKGYTVVYESAQNIFDLFEEKKFGRAPEADTDRFLNADLLIMDDLGTEHITQFTVSVLYNLINERTNKCKATIISTNLSPDELKLTYKPRIFSRLFGDFKVMSFKGMDIRLQKLGE